MTTVIRNELKKQRSQIFWAGGNGSSSGRYQAEVSGRLWYESSLAAGHKEVKTLVGHQPWRCKDRRKFTGPHFGVSLEKGPQTRRESVKIKPTNKHVRTKTANQEENLSYLSSLSLSLSPFFIQLRLFYSPFVLVFSLCLFSCIVSSPPSLLQTYCFLCPANASDSVFIRCFFLLAAT